MNPSGNQIHMNQQVRLTMEVKLLSLQRAGLKRLTFEQLVDAIVGLRWKHQQPELINILVDDILSVSKDEVLSYLRSKAIIDGYSLKLSDFEDLIGGN